MGERVPGRLPRGLRRGSCGRADSRRSASRKPLGPPRPHVHDPQSRPWFASACSSAAHSHRDHGDALFQPLEVVSVPRDERARPARAPPDDPTAGRARSRQRILLWAGSGGCPLMRVGRGGLGSHPLGLPGGPTPPSQDPGSSGSQACLVRLEPATDVPPAFRVRPIPRSFQREPGGAGGMVRSSTDRSRSTTTAGPAPDGGVWTCPAPN